MKETQPQDEYITILVSKWTKKKLTAATVRMKNT